MLNFSLKQLIEATEFEETGGLLEEVGGLDCVDLVQHRVVVDG